MMQPSKPDPEPGWKPLLKTGGISAMIFIVYSVVTMILLLTIGGQPDSVEDCFRLLQQNRIIGLLRLDVLTVIVMPFYYLIFLGLYFALRQINPAYTMLSTLLVFAGITLFLSTPSVFSMVSLSDQFNAATSDIQRNQLLAAGKAIQASNMWQGTGALVGGILIQSGAVLISIVMLRGNIFNKITAYAGIVTHGLDLAHILIGLFWPVAGFILMAIAGPLYLLWLPLVGWRLIHLGRSEKIPVLQ